MQPLSESGGNQDRRQAPEGKKDQNVIGRAGEVEPGCERIREAEEIDLRRDEGLVVHGLEAEVAAEGERAFGVLRRACEGLVRHLPETERPPIHMMSYHIWAMCHGIAELFGHAETRSRAPIEAAELLEAGTAIYLRGLGLLGNS